ncbi:MAG TPA: hypothetical protein VKC61_09915 [Pyrinomonadaceae bacterium]|nr:hypothetical protein [Pyrinomonadaceae bacterium]
MRRSLFLLFVIVGSTLFSVNVLAQDQFKRWPDDDSVPGPPPLPRRLSPPKKSEPQQVTLFSRITQGARDDARSAFNFYGVRGDDRQGLRVSHNSVHLVYGSISIDHDTDWFDVSSGGDDSSRIKDLGEMQWADVSDAPFLPANPRSSRGFRLPGQGMSFEQSSDGQITRAVAGHMYVAHIKNNGAEFYAMFRVDALDSSKRCTISWRVMHSPKR